MMLLRKVYTKKKYSKKDICDREILAKVGYKVEDLELKVNILTYKMQYGTWPTPHQIHKTGLKKGLRNVRLTLSSSNNCNDWVKHILLSPRKNDSCISCQKHNYHSAHGLTELFDMKERSVYSYLYRDILTTPYSSTKSLKSDSDRMDSFERTNHKRRKISKSENLELQQRNAISLRHRPNERNARSTGKIRLSKDSNFLKTYDTVERSEKFAKTIDECKWYLKELHDSNKSLALSCSSSDRSETRSVKSVWLETQTSALLRANKDYDNNSRCNSNLKKMVRTVNTEEGMTFKESNSPENGDCANGVSSVMNFLDKNILPSKLNITFCTELLPEQSLMNISITPKFKHEEVTETSLDTLYHVKKQLNSLQNVLRAYDAQNSQLKAIENPKESNNNVHNVCQNVLNALISIKTEIESLNEKRKSKVSFDINTEVNNNETVQVARSNYEQNESDETNKNVAGPIKDYPDTFTTYCDENIIDNYQVGERKKDVTTLSWLRDYSTQSMHDLNRNIRHAGEVDEIYMQPKDDQINKHETQRCASYALSTNCKSLDTSKVVHEKITERVYYTFSSDSFEEKDTEKQVVEVDFESCGPNSIICCDQHSMPMDTEEDSIMLSPTSSHADTSRGSEFDDKTTAMLLQEALQFKQALLTSVGFKESCSIEDAKEAGENRPESECIQAENMYTKVKSNLLDIILEEQSAGSSAEKTSRTFVFLNTEKRDNLSTNSNMQNNVLLFKKQNIDNDENSISKDALNSSYYESSTVTDAITTPDDINNKELQENEHLKKELNNFQITYLNVGTLENVDTEKIKDVKHFDTLGNVQIDACKDSSACSDVYNLKDRSKDERNSVSTSESLSRYKANHDFTYKKIFQKNEFIEHFSDVQMINKILHRDTKSTKLFTEGSNDTNTTRKTQSIVQEKCINESSVVTNHKNSNGDLSKTETNTVDVRKNIDSTETLKYNMNLSLKRHLGVCSLIEQTLSTVTNGQVRKIFENTEPMFESSPSESKENSIEMNCIDNYTTSYIHPSSTPDVFEPLATITSTERSVNNEELKCQNIESNVNNHCNNKAENLQSLSNDAITIRESNIITEVENNYDSKRDEICNENVITGVDYEVSTISHSQQVEKSPKRDVHSNESYNINRDHQGMPCDSDISISHTNLVSSHTSLYLADGAENSIGKLNYTSARNSDDFQNLTHVGKEVFITHINNIPKYESDNSSIYATGNGVHTHKELDNRFKLHVVPGAELHSNLNEECNSKETNFEGVTKYNIDCNEDEHPIQEEDIQSPRGDFKYRENLTLNNKALCKEVSTSCGNITNAELCVDHISIDAGKPETTAITDKKEMKSINENISDCNNSLHQISSRNTKENSTKQGVNKVRSKSEENHTTQSGKSKKLITIQGTNDSITVGSHYEQIKSGENFNAIPAVTEDLSVEFQRGSGNTINSLHKKRSRSQLSIRRSVCSTQSTTAPVCEPLKNLNSNTRHNLAVESKAKQKAQLKPLLLVSKTPSRSCIPVLKSRLEAARRVETESRPRSPMRGPLTVTTLWRDDLPRKNQNITDEVIQTEGITKLKSRCTEEISTEKAKDEENCTGRQQFAKSCGTLENVNQASTDIGVIPHNKVVIYVNIFSKYDQNTRIVDPNKFLEYVKDRHLTTTCDENQAAAPSKHDKNRPSMGTEKDENKIRKVVTIVSSVINEKNSNPSNCPDTTTSSAKSVSMGGTLSSTKFKNICFLTVEQREIDVTAKPSVTDTSTSICDLKYLSEASRAEINKFQICGIPKELSNEEYISLLDVLNHESNFAYLQQLQNLCKELTSKCPKLN